MKPIRTCRLRLRTAIVLAIMTAAGFVFGNGCINGGRPAAAASSSDASSAPKAEILKPLTGAELYAINCNRCHPGRSPIERRAAEWKTILTHMRVRANLPATQARAILQYLQENSGS